ncbi:hypothetical protein MRX96_049550 [Rhipicephalus microplus]
MRRRRSTSRASRKRSTTSSRRLRPTRLARWHLPICRSRLGTCSKATSPSLPVPSCLPRPPPPPSPSFVQERRPPSLPQSPSVPNELNGPCTTLPPEEPPVRLRHPNNDRRRLTNHVDADDADRELRRRQRVEKQLIAMEEADGEAETEHHDMIEFAERHFNAHLRDFGSGPVIRTLSRRRKSSGEVLPKYEMVTYSRNSAIPTSHLHLYDPENVAIACSIFKDLTKYLRADGKPEGDVHTIQTIIGYGIEREELRDEILVQLVRQSTNNPSHEATVRAWLLIALSVVSFRPSKAFSKYLYSYLKKSVMEDSEIAAYAQYCLENLSTANATNRKMPPSTLEINAVRLRENLVCRFYFMDGRTKAIDIHPSITAEDAIKTLATKIGLRSLEGWALYECTPDHEHVIKGFEYLADIIYQWETCRRTSATLTKYTTISKKGPTKALGGGECRFVFRKRLFKAVREIPQDPVEVSLLYAQAVHDVVKADSFPVVERVALQLAGLQAQVSVGEPSEIEELDRYRDVESYIAERIRDTRPENEWIQALCTAHRTYGSGKSELVCKVWYLSIVMQYPLYGTALFPVTCRGYLTYDHQLLLGVSCEGVLLVNADSKAILNAYRYSDLESVLVNEEDRLVTVTLSKSVPDLHKCYLFETPQHQEVASLVASYWPPLAARMKPSYELSVKGRLAFEDRVKLHQEVMNCRRTLVDSGLLNKPEVATLGLFRSTLRRFNRNRLDKLRQEYSSEGYKSYQHTYWAFGKTPITQSFLVMAEPQVETTAIKVYTSILIFSGLLEEEDTEWHGQRDLIQLAQSIIECCMVREVLLNELFIQLIKQTTDHPDPNSRVNVRHWQLLSLLCSVAAPTDRRILGYLHAHLRHCAMDVVTEEGQFAQFALKCLMRTLETRGRRWPPSRDEVSCTTRRHPCRSKVHFLDGQVQNVDFDPCVSAAEMLTMLKTRINLRPTAEGYAIYEVIGPTERAMLPGEKMADAMSKWERWAQSQQGTAKANKQQYFLFKKHLMLDAYIDLSDPVEEELLFHQLVYNIRLDRFPVTEHEAVTLCALKAQLDYGDFREAIVDYRKVMAQCLPMRLLKMISADHVVTQHQALAGMNVQESKRAFLALLQSWPLHRATIFEVTQSYTSSWPKTLWFAVDQNGVHLLELRTRSSTSLCSTIQAVKSVVADMLSRLSAAVLHQTQSLAAMQAEDKECQDLRRSLSSSESWDHDLAIIDDILYHSDATSGSQAIVVPAKMRQAVLEVVHDGGGHMDVTRTLTKVRERYWWPNLTSSVTHYVTACQICQSNNRPISKSVGKMGLMPVSDVPFALIAIDHITMPAASGKKYILNVIDFATRFIVPAAVTSTSAKEVIAHLQSVFFRFGCPDDCMSDHGAAFESHQFKHFMHMHGAEIHYSVAYRAASNGLVERSNGTLVSVLRKLCPTDQTSWASKLEEAAFAINTSYSASSCFSPFELLYGYVPKLPYQRHRPATARTLQDRLLMLSQNRAVAASNTEEAQGKRKTAYDQSHRDHSFQVGQFVWVRRQEPVADGTGKLAPKFKGIYQITNQKTPVTFVVSRVTGQGPRDRLQDRIVHVSQLKHYVPPYVEPYIVKTQEWPLCDLSGSPSVGNELSQPPVSLGPAVLPPAVPSSRPHRQKRPPERLKDYSLSQ